MILMIGPKIKTTILRYSTRDVILNLLKKAGVRDPTGELLKEVDSWDVWNIDKDRSNELHNMSSDWLEKYVTLSMLLTTC